MAKPPLGDQPYKIAISREELRVLVEHRERCGEPMQSFVRRLIREQAGPSRDAGQAGGADEPAASAMSLPAALRKALDAAAGVEGRQPQELIEDAVRHYLQKRHRPILARGGQGYTQAEVRRLIAERQRNAEEGSEPRRDW